jgi:peptide/nickel transport system ATP-binding protein
MTTLLEAHHVSKVFSSGGGIFGRKKRTTVALEKASLVIRADRPSIIAIAGESGSGKTTLSRLILGLIQPTSGEIRFKGQPLHQMDRQEWRKLRQEVQAIFQDPFAVYNPFYKIDHALALPIQSFRPDLSKTAAQELIESALREVGLRPGETLGRYAHQLSGGQRQRIMVARALLLNPSIIVADEPVSMVDASLRATILESLLKVHQNHDISLVYITHDLTTAYQISQTILMLYQGAMVEVGSVDLVIKKPLHPYTQLLVGSIPLPNPRQRWGQTINEVETKPKPIAENKGCKFANRCPHVMPICRDNPPPLFATDNKRAVACYLYRDAPAVAEDELSALYAPL